MKKLLKEFKQFVSRGSVIDLAVGMLIGSAFTAIVTSIVKYIFTPLINLIPIGKRGTGLVTVLRPAVLDESGKVLTEALVLNWGEVIGAIITFFVTAVILFIIVKAMNVARAAAEKAKADLEAKLLKEKKEAEEKVPEVVSEPQVTELDLLKEILEVLKQEKAE